MRLAIIIFSIFLVVSACNGENSTTYSSEQQGSTPEQYGYSGGFIDLTGAGDSQALLVTAPGMNQSEGTIFAYTAVNGWHSAKPEWIKNGEGKSNFLGYSFADVGDVNGDGVADFAVGALNADGNSSLSGAVYIYRGGDTSSVSLAHLPGEHPLDKFGYAIAGGDLNGDGFSDVIVSSLYASGVAFQSGTVAVYFGGAELATTPGLVITGESGDSGVGASLTTGDINGDGVDDLIIGAKRTVMIYYGGADFAARVTASQTPDVKINGAGSAGGHAGSGFGHATAYIGDIDADGFGDFVVANNKRSNPKLYDSIGSVYIYRGGANIPAEFDLEDPSRMIIKIVGEGAADRFGTTLAVLPDITGDGKSELVVDAAWASGGSSGNIKGAGKVYLFDSENLTGGAGEARNASTAERKFSVAGNGSEFGCFLDTNANGEIFAGAPFAERRNGRGYIINARTGIITEFAR